MLQRARHTGNQKYSPLFPPGKIETSYASRITIQRDVVLRIRARKVYTRHAFPRQLCACMAERMRKKLGEGETERERDSRRQKLSEIYIPDSRHIRAQRRHRKLMVRGIYSRVWYIRACLAYLVTPRLNDFSPLVPCTKTHTHICIRACIRTRKRTRASLIFNNLERRNSGVNRLPRENSSQRGRKLDVQRDPRLIFVDYLRKRNSRISSIHFGSL